ncbi:MAG: cation diffusion facilitator family transporter, partial [Hyphomonadaceae bacterium]
TAAVLVAEIVGGVIFRSLALISDAAHMFTDTAALAIALAAIRIGRKPADDKRTFGYRRFEILAAALNASLLFLVALYILYEAYQRFVRPQPVESLGMLVVAAIGLAANFIAMQVLRAGSANSVNMRGAYLEVWADMLGSIGVIVGAVIIWFTQWAWVDPVIAVAIGLWVLPRTWTLLAETTNVLLEGVPKNVSIDAVRNALHGADGVAGVHDLHVWEIAGGLPSLSAHVVLQDGANAEQVRVAVAAALAELHIEHVTLQVEQSVCAQSCNHSALQRR